MFCDVVEIEGVVTCTRCKQPLPYITHEEFLTFRITRECFGEPLPPYIPPMPSLWRRINNFVRALLRHFRDRFKKCSKREIARRFNICEHCPSGLLIHGYCHHKDCGCPITASETFASKLRMKSEHCPMKYW